MGPDVVALGVFRIPSYSYDSHHVKLQYSYLKPLTPFEHLPPYTGGPTATLRIPETAWKIRGGRRSFHTPSSAATGVASYTTAHDGRCIDGTGRMRHDVASAPLSSHSRVLTTDQLNYASLGRSGCTRSHFQGRARQGHHAHTTTVLADSFSHPEQPAGTPHFETKKFR